MTLWSTEAHDNRRYQPIGGSNPSEPILALQPFSRLITEEFDAEHCEFCGLLIKSQKGECPALDAGRCRP